MQVLVSVCRSSIQPKCQLCLGPSFQKMTYHFLFHEALPKGQVKNRVVSLNLIRPHSHRIISPYCKIQVGHLSDTESNDNLLIAACPGSVYMCYRNILFNVFESNVKP